MNYIVLDLEWNQCPYGKGRENHRLPFEILEIGAVKLSEKKEVIGTFSETVCPVVYKQLHFRTKEIIDYQIEDLKKSRKFPEVAKDFLSWCGEDYILCTWGPSDLPELQRNMEFHDMEEGLPNPLFYYDIQKLFSILYEDGKVRRSLENAVEFLQIEKKTPFHRAFEDTYYTAQVMAKMDWEQVRAYQSVDYYHPPVTRKDEIHLRFSEYEKFVSKLFPTKEALMSDRVVLATRCLECGRLLRKPIRWFLAGQKQYLCVAECPKHGYVKGKIRIKKTANGQYFAVRTTKMASEAQVEQIRLRKEELKQRNKERKKRKE